MFHSEITCWARKFENEHWETTYILCKARRFCWDCWKEIDILCQGQYSFNYQVFPTKCLISRCFFHPLSFLRNSTFNKRRNVIPHEASMELLYLYTYMKNHICRWIYYLNNPNPNASIPGTNPPPHSRPTWASSLEVDHNNLSRVPSRPTPPCGGPDIGRSRLDPTDRELTEFSPGRVKHFLLDPFGTGAGCFLKIFGLFFLRCLNICWVYIRCLQSKTKTRGILLFKQITVVKSLPNVQLSALFISSRNPFCFLSQQTPGISPRVSWLHPRGHVRITSKPAANIIARHITQRLHRAKVTSTTWKKICRASWDVW